MEIRLLIARNEKGSVETVLFTYDRDMPLDEFLHPGQSLDFDNFISCDLPDSFPFDYFLRKS